MQHKALSKGVKCRVVFHFPTNLSNRNDKSEQDSSRNSTFRISWRRQDTLLNHVLANREGLRVAVIVNDMSEVNIDASLIQRGTENAGAALSRTEEKLVEMSNGCICCTLREDLLMEVRKLCNEDRFDYLLIESTGIGEPMPVATTFDFRDEKGESLNDIARIDTMVTVVDALNLLRDFSSEDLLAERGEVADDEDNRTLAGLLTEQIEFADVIVISKIDQVTPDELYEVVGVVKALNPIAEVLHAEHGDVPLRKILGTGRLDLDRKQDGRLVQGTGWRTYPRNRGVWHHQLRCTLDRATASGALRSVYGETAAWRLEGERLCVAGKPPGVGNILLALWQHCCRGAGRTVVGGSTEGALGSRNQFVKQYVTADRKATKPSHQLITGASHHGLGCKHSQFTIDNIDESISTIDVVIGNIFPNLNQVFLSKRTLVDSWHSRLYSVIGRGRSSLRPPGPLDILRIPGGSRTAVYSFLDIVTQLLQPGSAYLIFLFHQTQGFAHHFTG
ncbi:CobW/HypB/UreG, nucleotide-binding domain [Nitrosospira multiformis]|uniref:CobW/HypB/UreG, nucleotide-binding domain n=1 Tax=Nitrosospira multiformis TaxID=1231 RepID=A0A1I7HDD0_9PROT|nr:CobW/HypB/UreG, nucleotide-binding domain [Nitrosospira multiformis]